MGAGASRPPQPPEEGEPRRAVTSELGLSSHLGRARQDCRSRWPSTYQLAVRQARDAFVLVRPRANLGWRRRRAPQRGHRAGGRASRGASPARPPPEGEGGLGIVGAIPGGIRCAGAARRGRARQRARPVRVPSETAGAPGPLARLGSARGAMVGLRGGVRGRCARLPSRGRLFLLVCLLYESVALKQF